MHEAIATIAAQKGAKPLTIAKWRQRGFVPHRWRLPILQELAKKGVLITASQFEFQPTPKKFVLAKPRRRKNKPKKRRAA